MEVVDSIFRFLPLQVLRERRRANQLVFGPTDWLGHMFKQDVLNAHAPQCKSCTCCFIINAFYTLSL